MKKEQQRKWEEEHRQRQESKEKITKVGNGEKVN